MAATQEELYEALEHDAALSWSERDLPQRLRTKHVHSLHPYLGKYVPQLVEELLRRHVPAGGRVLDPFAGSGTTLVQSLESGYEPVGVDIAAFNCLLMRVKTDVHNPFVLEHELRDVLARFERGEGRAGRATPYLRNWFAPQSQAELLRFRSLIGEYESADVLRIVLTRAARSARLTTHFDLDFPKHPQTEPYWCHKHRRECRPVDHAAHFVRRYLLDTLTRLKEFARLRGPRPAEVIHGDARSVELSGVFDGIVTSPPYPGLIDYHEQHRYAYELLVLDDRREQELGAAASGTSQQALRAYVDGVASVLGASARALRGRGRIVIVVNDRRDLYPAVLERAGLELTDRHRRHVNRRTGRRAGEYFEDVLVARRA
ncbi:MAG TPA: DNA methyltransferase [Gaiellaceae bacterium]|nr:DNA methyltransferase [Gaiellaceae bacterium]